VKNILRSNFQSHPFHLVSPSFWPLFTTFSLLYLTSSAVMKMHTFSHALSFVLLAFFSLILSMSLWFRDIISEASYLGNHTLAVQRGLNMGVALFIVSEALFFLAVGLWRMLAYHLTENHHLGLESGILYWHFVNVIWIFLFISIYYWGS